MLKITNIRQTLFQQWRGQRKIDLTTGNCKGVLANGFNALVNYTRHKNYPVIQQEENGSTTRFKNWETAKNSIPDDYVLETVCSLGRSIIFKKPTLTT